MKINKEYKKFAINKVNGLKYIHDRYIEGLVMEAGRQFPDADEKELDASVREGVKTYFDIVNGAIPMLLFKDDNNCKEPFFK